MPKWNKKRAHGLITGPWMEKVRHGMHYCPRVHEVQLLTCLEPPNKEICYHELQRALGDQHLTMGLKNSTQLDKEYTLTLLATLEPDHPWFGIGWTRRPPPVQQEVVDNRDGFYDQLPASRSKRLGAARVGRQPKSLTEEQKNKRLEKQRQKSEKVRQEVQELKAQANLRRAGDHLSQQQRQQQRQRDHDRHRMNQLSNGASYPLDGVP
jgi:hypothetical protein